MSAFIILTAAKKYHEDGIEFSCVVKLFIKYEIPLTGQLHVRPWSVTILGQV